MVLISAERSIDDGDCTWTTLLKRRRRRRSFWEISIRIGLICSPRESSVGSIHRSYLPCGIVLRLTTGGIEDAEAISAPVVEIVRIAAATPNLCASGSCNDDDDGFEEFVVFGLLGNEKDHAAMGADDNSTSQQIAAEVLMTVCIELFSEMN